MRYAIFTFFTLGASLLAQTQPQIDAGRTLLLDREAMIARADEAGIAIAGYAPVLGQPILHGVGHCRKDNVCTVRR